MKGSGRIQITALLVVVILLVAVLPVYSFDRPAKYIDEMSGECIGTETFTITANDMDHAVLTVKGEATERYEERILTQETVESCRGGTPTQTFTCKGEVTKIEVYVRVPRPLRLSSSLSGDPIPVPITPIPKPPSDSTVSLSIKSDTTLYHDQVTVPAGTTKWLSFAVPNLKLNGTYTLELRGVQWYYGSGYANGRAGFDPDKDFCFRIYYRKKTTLYPTEVRYSTDRTNSSETVAANLQNGKATIKIPKEKINGATELTLSTVEGTKISWSLQSFHTVPETPARLSLPVVRVEDETTTFQVRYTDRNNDPPSSAKVYLNNVAYDLVCEDDDEYQWNGALYSITLPYEECEYYFLFKNGKEPIRMPEEGSLTVGALEKKMSEWQANVTEESQLIDEELERIDQYYLPRQERSSDSRRPSGHEDRSREEIGVEPPVHE